MLIEFSVANYRSFREKVTLSMVASSDDTLEGNTFAAPGKRGMRLLKSAALYGANASGKTNFLKAIHTMRELVVRSASQMQRGDRLPAESFKLEPSAVNEPSLFEVVIATHEERYVYGFSIDAERVREEWLSAARMSGERSSSRMLFERRSDGTVQFGNSWRGERAALEDRLRENALLLSVAAQSNNETVERIYDWFGDWADALSGTTAQFGKLAVIDRLRRDPALMARAVRFIAGADPDIVGLRFARHTAADARTDDVRKVFEAGQQMLADRLGNEAPEFRVDWPTILRRRTDGHLAEFDFFMDESRGTQEMAYLSAYWLSLLDGGGLLLIDEFESSLHPHIARQLLKSLHANEGTAQLIFTTHDTNLLDPELLRRDQIWFTERTPEGATSLYSLWDFKPRKGENLRKGYLNGRYGAVPFLGDWSFGAEEAEQPAAAE